MLPQSLGFLYWMRHTVERFLQFIDNWIELWDAPDVG